jgi:hypothetical protein
VGLALLSELDRIAVWIRDPREAKVGKPIVSSSSVTST